MTSQISLESLNLSWVHGILLCSFCPAWNSLPELISRGVGIRMSWVENFLKIDKRGGGGTSIRDQRVVVARQASISRVCDANMLKKACYQTFSCIDSVCFQWSQCCTH